MCIFDSISFQAAFEMLHTGPLMFELCDVMVTDPLILFVLQSYGVVSHTQHSDDEVDQGKDAVEPQKVVPVKHKNTKTITEKISP